MKRFAFSLLVLVFAGAALAQSPTGILSLLGVDLVALGASALLFAKSIQFVTEQIKGWWEGIPRPVLIALPFIFGIGGAYLLSVTVGITDMAFGTGGWFAYGFVSALMAGGWYTTQKNTSLREGGLKVS